jgi:trigger factor
MQVSVKTTSGLEREMTVSIPSERVETEVKSRIAKAGKTARIDGFRKGKVPAHIIKQRYGAGIRQEVISELINTSYGEALKQEDIRPAGNPNITSVDESGTEGFSYTATFEVYPEIKLKELAKLKIETLTAAVTDADIDDMLDNLRNQSASWEVAEKAAASGDQVTLHYSGSIDGEKFDGGTAQDQKIEIGAGRMIPGFEEGLVGLKAGDTKDLKIKFPDDYQAEDLKGKKAVFAIEIVAIGAKKLPELDDEFAARFGVEEGGVEALRAEVRKGMESELEGASRNLAKNVVMSALADANDLDLPKAAVHEEIHRMKHELSEQYKQQNQQIDPHTFPDHLFQERAERRVKLGLLVSEVLRSAEIKLDNDKVKDEVRRQSAGYDQPQEVEKYFYSNQELLSTVQMRVLEDQVVSHILDVAKVSEKESTYKDVIAAQARN